MANIKKTQGVIGILTGGGDVPGLNPAIRAVTVRALREGYKVIGLRRGWAGIIDVIRDEKADNSNNYQELTEEGVNRAGRTGGTFLHTSRTRPSAVKKDSVPLHLQDKYNAETNDLTPEVLKNLDWLGIDYLIPIGGDDTLSYAVRLYQEGLRIIAIPKTMDNDVPGTDYCIGFSTCVTRTIQLTNNLRTIAGSHERIMVLEVFGRYAGFTAMLPTMAGAANRCVIPEYKFNIDRLAELTGQYIQGKPINIINQKLGYMVRAGDPDAIDSIVPMAYGNLALNLAMKKVHGRLVVLKNGRYDNMPLDVIVGKKKQVDVQTYYNASRLRPHYESFEMKPLFIMTSE
jgi:6-phosphofructokinase 1